MKIPCYLTKNNLIQLELENGPQGNGDIFWTICIVLGDPLVFSLVTTVKISKKNKKKLKKLKSSNKIKFHDGFFQCVLIKFKAFKEYEVFLIP